MSITGRFLVHLNYSSSYCSVYTAGEQNHSANRRNKSVTYKQEQWKQEANPVHFCYGFKAVPTKCK